MPNPPSYCAFVQNLPAENVHRIYHDTQYGFPITSDNELFGRLILEINQAGLSWTTILNKQESFREAYSGFDIQKIANYGEKDIERLRNNPGVIRNKLKINAAIKNAQVVMKLQQECGSFKNWLDTHRGKPLNEWLKIFKEHFTFVGGEIVREFLVSTGYLEGAHEEWCVVYEAIKKT